LAINTPANNPAGYITAQGFTSQLNGLTQAISNANQGVALLQTAQGAITQQIGVVQQLNSIAVEAANGTQTSAEAQSLQTLVGQLNGQVNTIASTTQFNNISLLNGSFSGIQFQVGANEGQTNTLTIANLAASAIGLNASTRISSIFKTGGSAASGVVTASSAGVFTTSTVTLTGPTGGQAKFTVANTFTSAYTLATQVNNLSATTGIQAQATNTVTFNVTPTGTAPFAFTIQATTGNATSGAIGTAQTISALTTAQIISQINGGTSTSGITASTNTAGQLVLSQAAGDNISIIDTGTTGGKLVTTSSTSAVTIGTAAASILIQGQVQLQSSGAFTSSGALGFGQSATSTLTALSAINVSTTSGANTAINIVKYALATLNNSGGQLGAVQQAFQANINNLSTTSQNLTTALGVVQDANIPAVSTSLTQAQIQAQSGVAALKVSTQLQQAYLSLLP
jgi:flagellin